jgi:hypothetical protein
MIREMVDSVFVASCSKHVIWNWLSFVKGLDATDVNNIIDNSLLEANCAVVIDLCDLVGTIVF